MEENSEVEQSNFWEAFHARDAREAFYAREAKIRPQSFPEQMESIVIKGKRQLFVDNYVIEHTDNLKRVLHHPVRHDANPVLEPDRPREGNNLDGFSLIRDDEDDSFKLWYRTGKGQMAYATSRDCIHWEKPSLGLLEVDGSRDNNVVRLSGGGATVIKDLDEMDPERRYKTLGLGRRPVFGLYVAFSPDGVRWKSREEPVLTAKNDRGLGDTTAMMHDTARRRFIGFTKRMLVNPFGRGDWGMHHRCQCTTLSDDFETWTNPILALRPDDCDPPDLQIYGIRGFNYEGTYLGTADIYWSGEEGPKERTMDVQLICSRDGELWWRAGDRQAFIPLGPEGSWEAYMIASLNSPPIIMDDELWFFYNGIAERHRYGIAEHRRREPWLAPGHPEDPPLKQPGTFPSAVGIARLRRDGFVSVDAGPRPGRLLTKPLLFDGKHLHVNVETRRGCLRAELFEAKLVSAKKDRVVKNSPTWNWEIGDPLPGFSLKECVPVEADTLDGIVRWQGPDDLEGLSGKYIVIRFHIVDASLYSFWVQ